MIRKTLLTAVALATLTFLTACGGGDAGDDNVAMNSQASSVNVGGIGGSGAGTQGVGGLGGSGMGTAGVNVGGIGGSGMGTSSVNVGGIGGSGVGTSSVNVGGIGGSGVGTSSVSVGGIGGSGMGTSSIGGIGGSGKSGVAAVSTAHACSLQSVNVTIAGARVNANGAADPGSPGWVDVALAAPVRVNLLTLASGAPLPLDFSTLPDGTYGQIRLLLAANDAAAPLADSVVALAGLESALSVPSAAQGGLPLAARISVAGGQVSASWQGLDVCSAVAANSGAYALDAVTAGSTTVASAY